MSIPLLQKLAPWAKWNINVKVPVTSQLFIASIPEIEKRKFRAAHKSKEPTPTNKRKACKMNFSSPTSTLRMKATKLECLQNFKPSGTANGAEYLWCNTGSSFLKSQTNPSIPLFTTLDQRRGSLRGNRQDVCSNSDRTSTERVANTDSLRFQERRLSAHLRWW